MNDISQLYSVEAEQAVIGAMIIDGDACKTVVQAISPEHFYYAQNGKIYKALSNIYESGQALDFVTALDVVCKRQIFPNEEDAKVYLYGLTQTCPTTKNIKAYADIVYEKYLRRQLAEIGRTATDKAIDADIPSLLSEIEQKVYFVRNGSRTDQTIAISDLAEEFCKRQSVKKEYIKTGYARLDRWVRIDKGHFVIIAARPSVGKTALALNLLVNMAKQGKRAVFFSLETGKEDIYDRITSAVTNIDFGKIKSQSMTDDDWWHYATCLEEIKTLPINIVEASGRSVTWIRAEALRLKAEVVFVDYLSIIKGEGKSLYEQVTRITVGLHEMAQQTKMAVIALSQLNREASGRKPCLADLRESGQIEQSANVVILLHRAEGEAEKTSVIVAKNKDGQVGVLDMRFDGTRQKYSDIDTRR